MIQALLASVLSLFMAFSVQPSKACNSNGQGGKKHCPSPTPTVTVTPTLSPTAAPSATPTLIPTATPTATPTPTTVPLTVTNVVRRDCTVGSSCYGWLTNLGVYGTGFSEVSSVYLRRYVPWAENPYYGKTVGGDENTYISADFTNLPHCYAYNVFVTGSTGTVMYPYQITTMCP